MRTLDLGNFQHVTNLVKLPVVDCAYVEDRISRDIIGASQAGYGLPVQIINDFEHGEIDTGAEPDAFFKKFELPENPEQKTQLNGFI